jgi:radical SAM protein with 4Fe4S-binding SPASM domain
VNNPGFLSLVTGRLFNFIKIISSYMISRITGNVIHWGRPVSVSIEPTNLCNLHCPECPSGSKTLTRERGYIEHDTFKKIIDQLSPDLFWLTFYFQGEPFLHPGFHDMVRYAKSRKIYVSTSTNGHFLTETNAISTISSGTDRLIISLDGTEQETYSSYRKGGSYEKVKQGISEIVNLKKTMNSSGPYIVIQFLVLKSNQHQIGEIKQLGKDLGVNKVELKTAQFYDFEKGNPLMTDIDRFSRYKKCDSLSGDIPSYKIKNRLANRCFRMWSSAVITWDGWVVPCCYDKDAEYKMGNIKEQPFDEIWNSRKYNDFRKKLIHSRKEIGICKNCAEGMGYVSF